MASRHPSPRDPGGTQRASDADRELVADGLRGHYGDGRLSADELSARVEQALTARTLGELERLTDDLPAAVPPATRTRTPEPKTVTGFGRGLRLSLKIHLVIYVVVNVMLVGIWAASGSDTFWPIWPILGWGIGVGAHAAPVLAGVGTRRVSNTSPRRLAESAITQVAATVRAERPSLKAAAAPDGTVTILFSDIEGSTAFNERLGDLRWLELLRLHHAVVREQVAAFGGFEVKEQGDGFMIAFPSARKAVQCAVAIQKAIAARLGTHPDGPVRVRIGLHTGEAVREEADFYGKNVVLAARITAQADGGEILASEMVKQLTESAGDLRFEDEREVELAGLAGTHRVYRVA